MKVVFDVDGTLSNCLWRRHLVDQAASGDRKWGAFHDACGEDQPMPATVAVLLALHAAGHEIEAWSARPEHKRRVTETWMALHGIPPITLRMRADKDQRRDYIVKAEFLEHFQPDLVFDDRQSVVDMWRSRGIPCFQVAEGNF